MKKNLILCYSKTGNSRFIAGKLSSELQCDIEMVQPMFKSTGFLYLISLLKIPVPVNISKDKIKPYQEIIIIGPIWGGLLIAPLESVLKKCIDLKKQVHFCVTCESKEADKDGKYGYNSVLNKAKVLGADLVKSTTAFSTSLINGYDQKQYNINVKAKFTEDNYSEALKKKVTDLKNKILPSVPDNAMQFQRSGF